MKVRIPSRHTGLIREFYPSVDLNDLYIAEQHVFNEFIFKSCKLQFLNSIIYRDSDRYFILFEGCVFTLPANVEDTYNFDLQIIMLRAFLQNTQFVSNKKQFNYLSLLYSLFFNASKHLFNQLFSKIYNNKNYKDFQLEKGMYNHEYDYSFSCNFLDEKIKLSPGFHKKHLFLKIELVSQKFSKLYPVKNFSLDQFILDFTNDNGYNVSSFKEAKDHLQDYILLRSMGNY